MKTKLILAIVLLLCPSYELFATKSDSKELVQPTNTKKQESPVVLLLKKIKEKNKPEYSRNCCCSSWKTNADALNVAVEIEREIKKNGISSDDRFQLSYFLDNSEYNDCEKCVIASAGMTSAIFGLISITALCEKFFSAQHPELPWQRPLAIFTLSCLTCVATTEGCLATGKSPYLRNVLNEYEKNKTCPGKIEMVYSTNKPLEILPDAQDIV